VLKCGDVKYMNSPRQMGLQRHGIIHLTECLRMRAFMGAVKDEFNYKL